MGYKIDYEEMSKFQSELRESTNNYAKAIYEVKKALEEFINMSSFEGKTAARVKAYLNDVNLLVIEGVRILSAELNSKVYAYIYGYKSHVDPAENALINCDELDFLLFLLNTSQSSFSELNEMIKTEQATAQSLCSSPILCVAGNNIGDAYDNIMDGISELRTDIADKEMSHLNDLDNFYQMAGHLVSFMNEHTIFYKTVKGVPFTRGKWEYRDLKAFVKENSSLTDRLRSALLAMTGGHNRHKIYRTIGGKNEEIS